MKKFFALLLSALLMLSLAACGSKEAADAPLTRDEVTKQAIIDDAKRDGLDISFGADDSMTIVDPGSGETYLQNPDGYRIEIVSTAGTSSMTIVK